MMAVEIHPLTPDRWPDLVDLFGRDRGANSGCWCMWWRMPRGEWKTAERSRKRNAFHALVKAGPPPGILIYSGDRAVGWCAVGPRITLPQMNASRVAAPLDGIEGVWTVNCFFIRSGWRGQGLMPKLLAGALEFAARNGAKIVEACPIDTDRKLIWGEGFVGLAPVFRTAGFEEVARRSPTRPLVRKVLRRSASRSKMERR
jgi:predicted GNAT family acetyltransferase